MFKKMGRQEQGKRERADKITLNEREQVILMVASA